MTRESTTELRTICGECGHSDKNHDIPNRITGEKYRKGPCCYGGCPCALTGDEVREQNEPTPHPLFAGYSQAKRQHGVF